MVRKRIAFAFFHTALRFSVILNVLNLWIQDFFKRSNDIKFCVRVAFGSQIACKSRDICLWNCDFYKLVAKSSRRTADGDFRLGVAYSLNCLNKPSRKISYPISRKSGCKRISRKCNGNVRACNRFALLTGNSYAIYGRFPFGVVCRKRLAVYSSPIILNHNDVLSVRFCGVRINSRLICSPRCVIKKSIYKSVQIIYRFDCKIVLLIVRNNRASDFSCCIAFSFKNRLCGKRFIICIYYCVLVRNGKYRSVLVCWVSYNCVTCKRKPFVKRYVCRIRFAHLQILSIQSDFVARKEISIYFIQIIGYART